MEPIREDPRSVFNIQSQVVLKFLKEDDPDHSYLYEHQKQAVDAVIQQLNDATKPNIALVVLPTGCGKTGVAVLSAFALNATRVLVVTPSAKISDQLYKAFCGGEGKKMFFVQRKIVREQDVSKFKPFACSITKASQIPDRLHDPLMIINAHKVGRISSVAIEAIPANGYDLVIVDEAHHYPADTWRLLVDHFPNSRRLFLTATAAPLYRGEPILKHSPCFKLSVKDAIGKGIIRPLDFFEGPYQYNIPERAIAVKIMECLDEHDKQDPTIKHQAMVLTQTKHDPGVNPAETFKSAYETYKELNNLPERESEWKTFETYHGDSKKSILKRFDEGQIRALVIVGKLLEGYDNNRVSVVGIARNVAPTSTVLFAQFVGRAVRKANKVDPVTTMVVSHPKYNQRQNFEQFDKNKEGEDDSEEED